MTLKQLTALALLGALSASAAAITSCGDDTETPRDAAVGHDAVNGKDQSVDQPVGTPDTGADQALPDQGAKPDASAAKVVDKTHPGWGNKWCFNSGCHSKPPKGHTQTTEPSCAECHGGNGACDPNGANSGKKNHTKGLTCVSSACHKSLHSYTKSADCVACHFASAGLQDCGSP